MTQPPSVIKHFSFQQLLNPENLKSRKLGHFRNLGTYVPLLLVLPQAKVELARAGKIPTPITLRYLEVNLGLISSELPSNAISIWKNCNLFDICGQDQAVDSKIKYRTRK